MTRLDPAPGRQRERVVGAVVVLVGVAVLVLSIVALVGATSGAQSDVAGATVTLPRATASASPATSGPASSGAATSAPPSSASTSPSSATATATPGKLPLVVLNNTGQGGLAQTAAATFEDGGWQVTSTANFSGDILSTCAYYDPDVTGAQAAAEALMAQFPAVKRVKQKFGDLPAGPVVVVLTSDYTAR